MSRRVRSVRVQVHGEGSAVRLWSFVWIGRVNERGVQLSVEGVLEEAVNSSVHLVSDFEVSLEVPVGSSGLCRNYEAALEVV